MGRVRALRIASLVTNFLSILIDALASHTRPSRCLSSSASGGIPQATSFSTSVSPSYRPSEDPRIDPMGQDETTDEIEKPLCFAIADHNVARSPPRSRSRVSTQ